MTAALTRACHTLSYSLKRCPQFATTREHCLEPIVIPGGHQGKEQCETGQSLVHVPVDGRCSKGTGTGQACSWSHCACWWEGGSSAIPCHGLEEMVCVSAPGSVQLCEDLGEPKGP